MFSMIKIFADGYKRYTIFKHRLSMASNAEIIFDL